MSVHDLSASLDPLSEWFNQHADRVRLVAISSAT